MKIFEITADYRPSNSNKPKYYVAVENKKSAKTKFENAFSWLKVYQVDEVDEAKQFEILANPDNYIFHCEGYSCK